METGFERLKFDTDTKLFWNFQVLVNIHLLANLNENTSYF